MSESVRPPVAEEAAAKLREILFSGELKRGDKLPGEVELAARLSVGRSSVREALRLLAAEGAVELRPNRGAFCLAVCEAELTKPPEEARSWLTVNRETVGELLDARMCIEPFAAELCAKNIAPDALRALTGIVDRFDEAVKNGGSDQLASLEYAFHSQILDGSGNRFLIGMYRETLSLFTEYSANSFALMRSLSTAHEHRAILNAIAAHSAEEARCAMFWHLSVAKRRMTEL